LHWLAQNFIPEWQAREQAIIDSHAAATWCDTTERSLNDALINKGGSTFRI
jgi:hypothetical protein